MHANKRIFSFFPNIIKKDLRLTQKPQIFIVPIGHFKIVIMVALDWKSWAENDGDNPWKSLWHFGSPCRKSLSQQVVLRGTSMPHKWFGRIRWNEYPFNQPCNNVMFKCIYVQIKINCMYSKLLGVDRRPRRNLEYVITCFLKEQ